MLPFLFDFIERRFYLQIQLEKSPFALLITFFFSRRVVFALFYQLFKVYIQTTKQKPIIGLLVILIPKLSINTKIRWKIPFNFFSRTKAE